MKLKNHYWEIDVLRAFAIIMMVCYHLILDLRYLGIANIPLLNNSVWVYFYDNKPTFIIRPNLIFLTLVGISMTLAYNFHYQKGWTRQQIFGSFFKRGRNLLLIAMLFTIGAVLTYAYHQLFWLFGILHLIGLSLLLCFPLVQWKFRSLGIGLGIIAVGLYLHQHPVADSPWYVWWIGILPEQNHFIDHFPIFPYLGFICIGIFLGNLWYKDGQRQFPLPEPKHKLISIFQYIGQKSLWIYLLQQPILLTILLVLKWFIDK